MLNKKEHNEFLNKIKRDGVPSKYKKTLFGSYKHDTVVDIMADMLQSYRTAQINTIESLLEENSKLNMALNYFFLCDPDKPTSWEYNRSQAEELARAALEPDQYLTGGKDD